MGYRDRQARLRVSELVEQRVSRFRSDEDLWPIRVPREPLALDDIVRQALGDEAARFDVGLLRARTLLDLEWDDGSRWTLWVMSLPSGVRVFCDSGEDEHRILATGGRHSADQVDRQFLARLGESGGARFGIEMSGGAPAYVRSGGLDRDLLVEFFVHLLEVTGEEASVRDRLRQAGTAVRAGPGGWDFRTAVASWLDIAASKPGLEDRFPA